MIGNHHELLVRAELFKGSAYQVIRAFVHFQNRVLEFLNILTTVRRVRFVQISEEHMLQPVGSIEHASNHSIARFVDCIEKGIESEMNAEMAAQSVAVITAGYQSAASGEVIQLE